MAKVERESINFKLPKKLADALRTAARTRNTTATDLVIKGLHHVLGDLADDTENRVETRLHKIEAELEQRVNSIEGRVESSAENTGNRLTNLEQKLEVVTTKLAQLEGAIMVLRNNSGPRRSSSRYPNQYYQREAPQLQPFEEKNLALRLVSDPATLRNKRENLSPEEFIRWCKDRDPSGMGWRYEEKDKLYHPVK
ncbi:hypothetical protein [Iningainema tapete]|uniref:Uncharacterized protein n=1 Tax=Iningainema tapete BLCC-T55 TaxID=2748662 RepID=A0A8J7BWV8_9CYAN|nr:hypothetical protein [Iningainema tapete]MBD2772547.1 hypothetical protein [Iningainema tapete BLCC-T55]